MSYPGDAEALFDVPVADMPGVWVVEAHDPARQYRVVSKADDGFQLPGGGMFARIECAPGDTEGSDPGERCLVRPELPTFGGKIVPEAHGDHTCDVFAVYLPDDWRAADIWTGIEGHGDGHHSGNHGIPFGPDFYWRQDCGFYPDATAGRDGSFNPATRTIVPGPLAGKLHVFVREIEWHAGNGANDPNGGPGKVDVWHSIDSGPLDHVLSVAGPTLQNIAGKTGTSFMETGIYRPKAAWTDVGYWVYWARKRTVAECVAGLAAKLGTAAPPTPVPSPTPIPVPAPTPGPAPPPKPVAVQPLDDFWAKMVATTPYKNWLATKSGARDHTKLAAFAKGSDTVPVLETTFGGALLNIIKARVPAGLPPYTGAV